MPRQNMVKDIENCVFDFLWRGKTPRFRKEIIEAELKEGGMKLHNLILFFKCLRRLVTSKGNWTNIPQDMVLTNATFSDVGMPKNLLKE